MIDSGTQILRCLEICCFPGALFLLFVDSKDALALRFIERHLERRGTMLMNIFC